MPEPVVPKEGLHLGELTSMSLALDEPDTLLFMDERNGRVAARLLGIPLSGVIGAKKKGWIEALKPELAALREKAHFFMASALLDEALRAAKEEL